MDLITLLLMPLEKESKNWGEMTRRVSQVARVQEYSAGTSVINVRQTSSIFCCWCKVGEMVRHCIDCWPGGGGVYVKGIKLAAPLPLGNKPFRGL